MALRKIRKRHPLYNTWRKMIRRCYSECGADFQDYGARGITVCDQWRNDFWTFVADMGPRPSRNHSIDRWPNNLGNYEPGNCRWATPSEQARNTRRNRYITANGRTQLMEDWAREIGISPPAIFYRLRRGMSEQDAVTLKKQPGKIQWSRR
jgi:hypothetical protein